jgi:U2-associated protein SR140
MFKKQITTVVDIWEDWIVFPPDFTSELRRRLEGPEFPSETVVAKEPTVEMEKNSSSKFKTSSFQLATQSASGENKSSHASDGEPMDVSSDEESKPEDLDGEPVDIDGVPIDDIDGEPIVDSGRGDDLDGELIGDDVDGVPVEEDMDGTPIDT